MMRLPPFTYLAPRTLAEAVAGARDHGSDATFVAGGTDLYPNMKRRQVEPKVVIGLRAIPELRGVQGSATTGVTIGAGTTVAEIAAHPVIAGHYRGLATAATLVSSPQLRAMGTLGGNVCLDTRCNYVNQSQAWRRAAGFCLKKDGTTCHVAPGGSRCWAVSSSDTAPVLWSLGARVRLVGVGGERAIPIADLYRDDGIRHLARRPDEVLTDVLLPPADGTRSVYLKLRRRGTFDFPILGVAVAARVDDGRARDVRIVLGAVASAPREAKEAAAMLEGERLTPELIARAADAAVSPVKPLDNTDLTHPYRKKVARVFVARALRRIGLTPA